MKKVCEYVLTPEEYTDISGNVAKSREVLLKLNDKLLNDSIPKEEIYDILCSVCIRLNIVENLLVE